MKTIEVQVQPKQDLVILARVRDYSYPTGGIGSAEMMRVKRWENWCECSLINELELHQVEDSIFLQFNL